MVDDARRLQPLAEEAAEMLKALSHPARLMIVCELISGERSVGDLEMKLGIKQPNLSRELAKLREADILETRRESKVVFYRLADIRAAEVGDALCSAFLGEAFSNRAPVPFRPDREQVGGYGKFARANI